MAALCCPTQTLAVYRPRKPEKTALFQVIKKNYLTWCKNRENLENPVPHYIDKVFQNIWGAEFWQKALPVPIVMGVPRIF